MDVCLNIIYNTGNFQTTNMSDNRALVKLIILQMYIGTLWSH